jgi:hypothetical protein
VSTGGPIRCHFWNKSFQICVCIFLGWVSFMSSVTASRVFEKKFTFESVFPISRLLLGLHFWKFGGHLINGLFYCNQDHRQRQQNCCRFSVGIGRFFTRVDVTVDICLSFLQYLYLITVHLLPGDEVGGAFVFYVLQAGVQPLVLVTVIKNVNPTLAFIGWWRPVSLWMQIT